MLFSYGIVLWLGFLAAVLQLSQARLALPHLARHCPCSNAIAYTCCRCNNWCNRRGICSDPGDSGYCTCEIGYGGDDCTYRK